MPSSFAEGLATTLPERNLGTVPEISESDLVPTGSKCRFRIRASQAVSIAARTNICILPKGYDNRCTSTHTPQWNFGPECNSTKLVSCRPSRSVDS
ncbi:hypothetical protein Taro_037284 [Colocasia esculenta]|uniref:Uncharacterized protein n=1 Tax=Colocasia esculenta TaxID=4460 RepID=A0A843WIT0_COLES|nr:hypothetical protein [Colocasia esculenta]